MSTMKTGFRNVVCAAAALFITAVLGLSFVQSTAVVHWTDSGATNSGSTNGSTDRLAKLSIQRGHAWFGQPEPAVLVD
jgi:hypothetical protein